MPRFFVDVTGGNGDGLYTAFMAGVGCIHGIFGEDDRVVISERDTFVAVSFGGSGDGF